MWIEEQGNGKFKYCERYKDPLTNKLKKISITYDKKGPKAEKLMRVKLQEKIDAKLSKSSFEHLNLETLIDEYQRYYDASVKKTSSFNAKYRFEKIRNKFKNIILSKIKASMFNKYLNELAQQNLSQSTISSYKATLSSMMAYAYDMGYVLEDISKQIKMPKNIQKNTESVSDKYLEKEEVQLLLDFFRKKNKDVIADAIEFQTLTGLRFGELSAITFDDFDGVNNTLSINKTYTPYLNKSDRVHSPKTGTSIRTIYLNSRCVEIIKSRKRDNLERQLRYKNFKKTNYIFSGRFGTPYNRIECNKQLKLAAVAVGLHKNISTHTFRHTHISILAELKVPMHVIMERVGHSNIRTTQEIYMHVTNRMRKDSETLIKELRII